MINAIIAHHGSPGTIHDFEQLAAILDKYDLIATERDSEHSGNVIMGYSYGCVKALQMANRSPRAGALIMIAPYLSGQKQTSPFVKTILKTPVVGNKILAKKADRAIEDMLKTSSFPQDVPASYRLAGEKLKCPNTLKKALLEKNESKEEILAEIEKFNDSGRPLLVIYGNKDQTSDRNYHVSPLEQLENARIEVINDGGHALLWTHTEELSNIIESFLDNLGGSK